MKAEKGEKNIKLKAIKFTSTIKFKLIISVVIVQIFSSIIGRAVNAAIYQMRELFKGVGVDAVFLEGAVGLYVSSALNIIIIVALITYIYNKLVLKRLHKLIKVSRDWKEGRLSTKVDISSSDEIGVLADNFNMMSENLHKVGIKINNMSERLSTSSTQLEEVSRQTVEATNQVAASIESIANEAEEQANDSEKGVKEAGRLSESIDLVAKLINKMTEEFNNTSKLSEKGIETLGVLSEKSDKVFESEQELNKNITEMDESVSTIGTIVETISAISRQTNLLAFNAAIESARAGMEGKGFTVLAEEIRKLAVETSKATENISRLIQEVKEKSSNAVNSINDNKVIFDEQMEWVNKTEEIFKKLSSNINSLFGDIKGIEDLNKKMTSQKDNMVGIIENISLASQQVSSASQQVSASTEETLAATEQVLNYAEKNSEFSKELKEISSALG